MPLPLLALLAPSIISGVSGLLSGAAKGSAEERGKENTATGLSNQLASSNYNTKQDALMKALLGRSAEATNRFGTQQQAATGAMTGLQGAWTNALGNESEEKIALAKLAQSAPTVAAKQSILGSLMKNMQPHTFTSPSRQIGHITNVKGGMSAANLDPMTRAQGEELLKSAMQAQLSGGNLPERTNFREGIQDWGKSLLEAPKGTDFSTGLIEAPTPAGYKKAGKGESILSGLGLATGLAGQVAGGLGGNDSGSDDGGYQFNNRLLAPQQTPWAQPAPRTALANPNVFENLADQYEYD